MRSIIQRHKPVLLNEVIEYLNPKPGENFIDCTVGGGGHSEEILKRTSPDGKLLGIDLDEEAINITKKNLKYKDSLILVKNNFARLKEIFHEHPKLHPLSGILYDLGLSTYELEDQHRGFSFQIDAPLDMRFDKSQNLTACHILNNWSREKLIRILWGYGQEKFSRQIIDQVINIRKKTKITKTRQLAEAVLQVYRKVLKSKKDIPWIGGIHPATKTFMALRMAVNNEFENLEKSLPQAVEILKHGGRIAVISFHSGEDKIVKNFFRQESKDCLCPPEIPQCVCKHKAKLKIITKKPIAPGDVEVRKNPKARSAKLRVAEKL